MVDITIKVRATNPPPLPIPVVFDPVEVAARPRRGDICGVFLTSDIATQQGKNWFLNNPIPPGFVFVHITGVPGSTAKKVRDLLKTPVAIAHDHSEYATEAQWLDRQAQGKLKDFISMPTGELVPDPNGKGRTMYLLTGQVLRTFRFKRWKVKYSAIPKAARDKLLADGQGTFTWTKVKPYIRKRNVPDKFNPDLDDDTQEITDADVV